MFNFHPLFTEWSLLYLIKKCLASSRTNTLNDVDALESQNDVDTLAEKAI